MSHDNDERGRLPRNHSHTVPPPTRLTLALAPVPTLVPAAGHVARAGAQKHSSWVQRRAGEEEHRSWEAVRVTWT